jgi:hypothetical protein
MYFLTQGIDYKDNLDGTYTLQDSMTLVLDDGYLIRIPVGFTWNGASIPRAFWRICGSPMTPENVRASCIHDFLFSRHTTPLRHFGFKKCNQIFYEVLRIDKKFLPIAKIMYFAVTVFGRYHYKRKYAEFRKV